MTVLYECFYDKRVILISPATAVCQYSPPGSCVGPVTDRFLKHKMFLRCLVRAEGS